MPTAIEEFLRAYAPVTMAREVVKETADQRLHVQAGRDGAAVVPRRLPRPGDVPGRRQGHHRPQGEPARRLRPRHPPLRRLQPRAHGDDGGGRGTAEAHPRVQPRRRGDVVGRHRARPAQAAHQDSTESAAHAAAHTPTRRPTGPPTGTISTRTGSRTRFRSGTSCGRRCPIAHTERFNGVYLPTRYEDVRAIAYDPEHFSSRRTAVREVHPPRAAAARRRSRPTRPGTASRAWCCCRPSRPRPSRR